jgi:NADPH-dependent 2,4-dienoyl-CoA reductase/sulfur reductase-like enzyme
VGAEELHRVSTTLDCAPADIEGTQSPDEWDCRRRKKPERVRYPVAGGIMSKETADVLVVGCGPIGAYACWRFARKGLRVVGLEARQETQAASDIGVFHFERHA